ncbi:MAG: DUF1146 domain-containing protein [Bacilli bacterium]|nr:DUF1146 domain-containing protein [Bacilli bacterium]
MIKIMLYMLVFLFIIWAMEGLDLNKLFKQSRILQARIIYIVIALSLTYLTTNFLFDFFNCFSVFK